MIALIKYEYIHGGINNRTLVPYEVNDHFTLPTMIHHRRQTTTPGTTCPTLCDKCVGSFTSHRIMNISKGCETGPPASDGMLHTRWVRTSQIVARARKSRAETGVAAPLPQSSLDFFSPSPQFRSSRPTESNHI